MKQYYRIDEQQQRREEWFAEVRKYTDRMFNPDGSGKLRLFDPPWRETLWALIALYDGEQAHIDLANMVISRFNSCDDVCEDNIGETNGKQFGIFQSNFIAGLLHAHRDKMTAEAIEVCQWHCNTLFRTFYGSAQPDYMFNGANDNMPIMATCGLILGGEAMGNEQAVKHGVWSLNQLRRHFSRCAWLSEYGSSTYSAISLSGIAKIANYSLTPGVRELALEIEARIWAELALHFHPGTYMQAGPHLRAYSLDCVGHTHNLEFIYWLVLGEKVSGRNAIASFFHPDGKEIIHMKENNLQTMATYCERAESTLHLPQELAGLFKEKSYPARDSGRSEVMWSYDGCAGATHTQTYMEEAFSIGTANVPLCYGTQSNQLFITCKRKPEVESFKDASTIFYRYLMDSDHIGEHRHPDTGRSGEYNTPNKGWCYAFQKDNVALLSCTPALQEEKTTGTLKLALAFPMHYGRTIKRMISGSGEICVGDVLSKPTPLAVEAGEVYIHIVPLLPTKNNPAIRFCEHNDYEVIELINYEGEEKTYSPLELSMMLNGFVITVEAKDKYESLESFMSEKSDFMLKDYLFGNRRFIYFIREDAEFELVYSNLKFGVQTEAVDGRPLERPMFYSNNIDVSSLPFMSGKVEANVPFFPWDKLVSPYFDNSWLIGTRGLKNEFYDNVTGELLMQ